MINVYKICYHKNKYNKIVIKKYRNKKYRQSRNFNNNMDNMNNK